MMYDFIINEDELISFKKLVWMVHVDETRNDPKGEQVSYELLVALENYRKHVMENQDESSNHCGNQCFR